MNLKKIELHGFKSFADKTEIAFESNITGIVGPNGCGKSNVADAVRWVLGEQSPGVLRCKKMQEVIFSGTTNRKSLSYCEVSLYLDNTTHRYPVDYDEVVITRKLFRNGDSEYSINRTVCRLRDIIDLFRDSGIGREGYSIIGQGKIEEILSAKPEARRQIFEEAAGISRHKARKIETERKLERTRDNLSRVQDMVQEIGSRLGPLEKEAEDAKKVKDLKKQLKLTEIMYYLYQTENSQSERGRISKRLEAVNKDKEGQEARLDALNKEYNIGMMDLANSDILSNRLRDEITDFMVRTERNRGESQLYADRLRRLQQGETEMREEKRDIERRLDEKDETLADKEKAFAEKSVLLLQKNEAYQNLEKQLEQLSLSVERQEKTIEKSNELLFENMDKITEVDKDKTKLELEKRMLLDSMGENKEAYRDAERAMKEATAVRDGLQKQWDALAEERAERVRESEAARKNYTAAAAEWTETELNRRKQAARQNELDIKIKMLEEYKRDFAGYQDVVRRLMNDAEHDGNLKRMILGTVGQVITVPKDLQLAIEVALGGNIQNIITENEYDAGKLIDHLRQRGHGRATFLPIATVRPNPLPRDAESALDEDGVVGLADDLIRYDRRFSGIFSNLLGRTVVVETKEDGMRIAKEYRYSFRIVTMDGVLFQQSGAISGGSQPGKNTRILSRESELEDLKKKQKTVAKDLELLDADLEDLARERDELEKGVKILDARVHKLDVDLEALHAKVEGVDNEVKMHREALDKLAGADGVSATRIRELEELIKSADESHEKMLTEKMDADDFLNEVKETLFKAKQERAELQDTVKSALVEVTSLQSELDGINRDIAALRLEKKVSHERLSELTARLATNDKDIRDAQIKLEQTAIKGEDKEKLDDMRAQLTKIDQHKADLNRRMAEVNEERENLNREIGLCNEKRVREESLLERLDSDIANLSVRIREDYDLDYDRAKGYLEGEDLSEFEFNPIKAQADALTLRRKIERIGPVNELAEEKFQSEKDRYDDCVTQMEDVRKAEADLLKVIEELTSEMMDKFTKSFEQINLNFQEVFRELFGGGMGKLVLEREEGQSALDAGIEIMAEPPGKKPQRMSLLSGGERALTAIAILFAIIKLNPMPFSILDEIEAALDEANASLFAQYLRKFSGDTQFIVVTHRKPTMEQADVLYGVTQQERGISKLVSVKLADALKAVAKEA